MVPPAKLLRVPMALLALAISVLACDIPTDAPQWEQRWIIPGDETTVGVEELLPSRVQLTPDRSAFAVQVDPVVFQESLGSLCPACQPFDGQNAPKPPFLGDFQEVVVLPEEVEGAQVRSGRIQVVAMHDFGFDPLRPPGGGTGSITVAIRDGGPGGPILDSETVNGAQTAFGPDVTLVRTMDYSGPVSPEIWITVTINSPEGGLDPVHWVPVRIADRVQVTATSQELEATSALVDVSGESFDLIETDLDVEDLDEEVVDRIVSGAFDLEIGNPWSLGASFTLTIDGPTVPSPIAKLVTVPATPTSTVRVDFTESELRSFLGQPNVSMTGQGTVDPGSGAVTLEPDQTLTVDTRIDLVILIG
jgi:hypothetical protein